MPSPIGLGPRPANRTFDARGAVRALPWHLLSGGSQWWPRSSGAACPEGGRCTSIPPGGSAILRTRYLLLEGIVRSYLTGPASETACLSGEIVKVLTRARKEN